MATEGDLRTRAERGGGATGGRSSRFRRFQGRGTTHLAVTAAWVLILSAAVGAGVGAAVGAKTPTYQSTAQLIISDPRAVAASTDAGVIGKLAALRIQYLDLLSTQALDSEIASTAGLPVSAVSGSVFADAPVDSLLLNVNAQTNNGQDAIRLASAAASTVVATAVTDQLGAGVPAAQRYSFTVVTPATSASKISPTFARSAAAGALAGFLAFVLLVVAVVAVTGWRSSRSRLA